MKKLIIYLLTSLSFLGGMTGCDNGFDEMNTNPVQPTSLNPIFLMNNAVIEASHSSTNLMYELAIVQQIISPNGGVLAGGNFNQDNRPVTLGNWNKYYRGVLKHTADVKNATREVEARSNLYNMARILHSYAAMVLTDTYGDVPYFQAGLGFAEGNVTPAYDAQQQIYQDVLKELEQASAALSTSKPIETGDILYGGNIEKWQRLGYSLMLRAAMRHSKVDENTARTYAAKAVAGGVMQSNDDNAVIRHDFNYSNGIGNTLTGVTQELRIRRERINERAKRWV
jgi:hypothetical protein